MLVQSYEIADADLRLLHNFLLEVGGFQFRAGGNKFFVMVGERGLPESNSRQAHMILAQSEADTAIVDVIAAGGEAPRTGERTESEVSFQRRTKALLDGFAIRHELNVQELD